MMWRIARSGGFKSFIRRLIGRTGCQRRNEPCLLNLIRYQQAASVISLIKLNLMIECCWNGGGISVRLLLFCFLIACVGCGTTGPIKEVADLCDQGIKFGENGEHQKSIDMFTRVIELAPQNIVAYYNRGVAFGSLGKHDQAIADFNMVIKHDPQNSLAFHNRGREYFAMIRHEQAIADITKSIELYPQDATAFYDRGVAYSSHGKKDLAMADYKKAIEIDSQLPDAFYNLGCLYSLRKQPEEALAHLKRSCELDPSAIEDAKTDTDFDNLRTHRDYLTLMESFHKLNEQK